MLTNVYIDGLNLYYRALRGTALKWLDVVALSEAALPKTAQIQVVNYYTAHVSGRVDPDAPRRQHAYLRAMSTRDRFRPHFGNFLSRPKWAGIVHPLDVRPRCANFLTMTPETVFVWKTEEKGSDVNLGVHLIRDAAKGAMKRAAVLTADTDLAEAIRICSQDFGVPVDLLTPVSKVPGSLDAYRNDVRHIKPYLRACQLPPLVELPNGKSVAKPMSWERDW